MTPASNDRDPTPVTKVGVTALMMTPIVIIARGVAFFIPMVIAHLFGVTGVTDAYFYALAVPTFSLVVATNAASTVATPIMADLQKHSPDQLPIFVGTLCTYMASFAILIGIIAGVLCTLFLEQVSRFDRETSQMTAQFLFELIPFMVLVAANTGLRASCEVRGCFKTVAASPLIRASIVLTVLTASYQTLGAHSLPVAIGLGEAGHLAWLGVALRRDGLRPKPGFAMNNNLINAGKDMLPLLIGESLVAANIVFDKIFASWLDSGSVALLEYADRLRLIPQTLIESTIIPVAFATWANLSARGNRKEYSIQVDQSLRWVAAWTIAPIAGCFVARHAIVTLVYRRGAFTEHDVVVVADLLGWYLPGVWMLMLGALAVRSHIIERNFSLILWLGVSATVLNLSLNAILIQWMGITGVAAATTVVSIVMASIYLGTLYPMLQESFSGTRWVKVAALFLLATGSAAAIEWLGTAPESMTDPKLWMYAVGYFCLLGFAIRISGPRA